MGRPLGGKNNIRTPEEKEAIVLEWLNGKAGYRVVAEEQGVKGSVLKQWKKKYLENGIEGLKSRSGKHSKSFCASNPFTELPFFVLSQLSSFSKSSISL